MLVLHFPNFKHSHSRNLTGATTLLPWQVSLTSPSPLTPSGWIPTGAVTPTAAEGDRKRKRMRQRGGSSRFKGNKGRFFLGYKVCNAFIDFLISIIYVNSLSNSSWRIIYSSVMFYIFSIEKVTIGSILVILLPIIDPCISDTAVLGARPPFPYCPSWVPRWCWPCHTRGSYTSGIHS